MRIGFIRNRRPDKSAVTRAARCPRREAVCVTLASRRSRAAGPGEARARRDRADERPGELVDGGADARVCTAFVRGFKKNARWRTRTRIRECRVTVRFTAVAGAGCTVSLCHCTLVSRPLAREEGDRARGGGYEGQGQEEKLTTGEALVAAY
eukprot:3022410-Prymnesium_polylepis.2